MFFSYFDTEIKDEAQMERLVRKLRSYRDYSQAAIGNHDDTVPEYALAHVADPQLQDTLSQVAKQFKGIKHLVLVGIGGSNLGTEAVHAVLGEKKVQLHSLDTVAPYQLSQVLVRLSKIKKMSQIAVCIVSKSGGTAETVVNAGVLLSQLEERFGSDIYQQTVYIGNSSTPAMKAAKCKGATCIAMPDVVGGRYSVATEVGLVPLVMLGHDVEQFMAGVLDATGDEFESVTALHAARLYTYITKKYSSYTFFAFEPRLCTLGMWYRQLHAESLGKAITRSGKEHNKGFIPTVASAVDLHSVGQLYLSGFSGVYTDFVTFDDFDTDFFIPKKELSTQYGRYSMQEVATAIYSGVVSAYQERQLPYRTTIFTEDLAYSLGVFMGMRMQEIMYTAELLDLNAFDQPNVELYKDKTREILGL